VLAVVELVVRVIITVQTVELPVVEVEAVLPVTVPLVPLLRVVQEERVRLWEIQP